ncbi:MAG: hypothetical protein AAFR35_04825 [Pseudomonadota bacterium]
MPLQTSQNCGLSAEFDHVRSISVGGVFELRDGTVAQRVNQVHFGTAESLVATDCGTGDVAQLFGAFDPPSGERRQVDGEDVLVYSNCEENASSLDLVLRPLGKLHLTADSTAKQINARASRLGYDVAFGVNALQVDLPRGATFDPYCGCALLHPESRGARLSVQAMDG